MKGAIFDVDGTLLDSMEIWEHAGARYLKSLHKKADSDLGKILFPMTMEGAAEYMKERFELRETVTEIVEGVTELIHDFYLYEVQPKPGVLEFLKQMKEEKFVMTLATSGERFLAEAALTRIGIRDEFGELFTCSDIGAGKDHPKIYEAALKSMGTAREETWVFEDAVHAAATAHSAGFPVVGIYDNSSKNMQKELKELSDCYMKDFEDFEIFRLKINRKNKRRNGEKK